MAKINKFKKKKQKNLLLENAETNNVKAAKNYLRNECGKSDSITNTIIDTVKHNIYNVKKEKYKFLQGVCRIYMTGDLADPDTIGQFNKTLYYLASPAHVNEYDKNLNGLSAKELITKFASVAEEDMKNSSDELDKENLTENVDYVIVPIHNFEEASEYAQYTDWCITTRPDMFNAYTSGGTGRFYFCLAKDFEDVPKEKGENCPLDTYGLSMIAVSIFKDGTCNTITSRWNHDNGSSDSVMTPQELSRIIGRNFYKTFLPYSPEEVAMREMRNAETFVDLVQFYDAQEIVDYYPQSRIICTAYDDDEEPENGNESLGHIHGLIIDSSLDDILNSEIGEDKYMIFTYPDLEPAVMDIFDHAEEYSLNTVPLEYKLILVKQDKKWNVLKFADEEYVFSEWLVNKPKPLINTYDKLLLFNDNNQSMIVNTNGEKLTPFCDFIDFTQYSDLFFIQQNKNEPGAIYKSVPDGTLKKVLDNITEVKFYYMYMGAKDTSGKIWLLGSVYRTPQDRDWKILTDVPMDSMNPSPVQINDDGDINVKVIGADGNTYRIDLRNLITYDTDGNVVCDLGKVKENYEYRNGKYLLLENAESNNVKAARNYMDTQGISSSTKDEIIKAAKHDIPNVKKEKCKFMLGVCRIMLNKELNDAETILKFNRMLSIIASPAHANEYDRDLNGLSAKEIIDRFSPVAQNLTDKEREELDKTEFTDNTKYTIVPINSFEDAEEYSEYTDWCVTYDEDMFMNYTSNELGRFYFCLADGYQNLEPVKGEGCPLDEYGLSMIAVSVYADGSCNTITCRWNHANGGNDHIMTPIQLSNVLGKNFYQTFLPWSPEEIAKKEEAIVEEISYIISHNYDPYELVDSSDVKIISKKIEQEKDDDEFDEEYEDEDYDDYYYDNDEDDYFANNEIYGLIVSTPIDEDLDDKYGDCDVILDFHELEPIMYELYTKVEIMNYDNADYDDVRLLVQKGKKWNVLNLSKKKYLFNEWLSEKPEYTMHTANKAGDPYGTVDFIRIKKDKKEQVYDANGNPVTGWVDNIKMLKGGKCAYVENRPVKSLVNLTVKPTDVITDNIDKFVCGGFNSDDAKVWEKDGSIYMYGPDNNGIWRRASDLKIKPYTLYGSSYLKGNDWTREITAMNNKRYYIDIKNGRTLDEDGNVVSEDEIKRINSSVKENFSGYKRKMLLTDPQSKINKNINENYINKMTHRNPIQKRRPTPLQRRLNESTGVLSNRQKLQKCMSRKRSLDSIITETLADEIRRTLQAESLSDEQKEVIFNMIKELYAKPQKYKFFNLVFDMNEDKPTLNKVQGSDMYYIKAPFNIKDALLKLLEDEDFYVRESKENIYNVSVHEFENVNEKENKDK